MRRRDKAGRKALKAQRHKTLTRRNEPKVKRHRGSSANQETVVRLARELDEAREQLTATSELLKVISSTPGELEPVFEAILENATQICEARFGTLNLYDGTFFHRVAIHNPTPQFAMRLGEVIRPHPESGFGTVARTKQIVHIDDVRTRRPYLEGDEANVKFVDLTGARTVLAVPMLKNDELLGLIAIFRQEVRPFTDRQIDLVKTFAAQAVIAIENTRLLNEQHESLERQTATSEVLRVIASSPGTLEPVFQTILASATRICEARFGQMFLFDRGNVQVVAQLNVPAPLVEWDDKHGCHPPVAGGPMEHIIRNKKVVHIPDVSVEHHGHPVATLGGAKTQLGVPMVKEDRLIGALNIYRQEVRPFTDKQVELVQNFAAQAVIAIENTRLLNELRESLEQQTATSDVLKVISSSPGELTPVFANILENATRLCGAKFATLSFYDGHRYTTKALHNPPPGFEGRLGDSWLPHPKSGLARVAATKQAVQIDDLRTQAPYLEGDRAVVALSDVAGARTLLIVPMLKDDTFVGTISIYRQEVQPFSEKQIALVGNFAAQAVIAIGNARLLNELRQRTDDLSESLEQQTATSDVLRVISNSPTNVQPVFDAIAESAVRLCDGQFSFVMRFDGKTMHFASCSGLSAEGLKAFQSILPMPAGEDTASGRAIVSRAVVEIPNVDTDFSYGAQGQGLAKTVTYRSIAAIPLLHDGNPIGAIAVARANAGSFPKRQIALLQAFADQAVIAIQNVRLFDEVQARTRELSKSLEDLRATQDRLVQTQKLASLGQLTAGIAHEIKNPLNFVNNFSGVSAELVDELQEVLKDSSLTEKRRDEIVELMDTLRSNLDKVVQHGKRADAIVKNMLLHSHQGSGEHQPVAINAIVEESLKLAYHGARAEKQNFNVMVEQSFDPVAGEADIFPQEITRVLLNLISNGVYATRNKTLSDGEIYKPILTASTKNLGDRVEIRIRDNGTGIPSDVKEKIFNPFFTTKPAGEGTGLGLSISHDIIVKQHGGSIEVDTRPGEFTEVRIVLPRTAAAISG